TLAFLKRRYPKVGFVWLMGSDNFAALHRWHHWRDIAATMPIAVLDRPHFRLPALAGRAARALQRARWPEAWAQRLAGARPPAWTLLTGRLSGLSSTQIREQKAREKRT
ncbi:MAG: nicotinic acid mononucleotide adenylyltransferase, partial [Hyphomicrobiaceae bacterium]